MKYDSDSRERIIRFNSVSKDMSDFLLKVGEEETLGLICDQIGVL